MAANMARTAVLSPRGRAVAPRFEQTGGVPVATPRSRRSRWGGPFGGGGAAGRRWRWGILGLVATAIGYWFLAVPVVGLRADACVFERNLAALKYDVRGKHWSGMVGELAKMSRDLRAMRPSMNQLHYLAWIPGIRGSYASSWHLYLAANEALRAVDVVLPALKRIAPVFGFRASSRIAPVAMTGQQKIQAVVTALPTIMPALRQAYPRLEMANRQLAQVDPAELRGLGPQLNRAVRRLKAVSNTVVQHLPAIEREIPIVAQVLGIPAPTRYLLFFQNSGELRPAGGFMTAYAYLALHDGRLGAIHAHDIYAMPNSRYHPPAPPLFADAFGLDRSYLRDANTSPDIPLTVAHIQRFYAAMRNVPPVQGMIFIDTWFVDRLIAEVGGINLPPPYDLRITPQNANLDMEYLSEKAGFSGAQRKAFLGLMLRELVGRALRARGRAFLQLVKTVRQALNQKLIILYFNAPQAERLAAHYDWAGTIPARIPRQGNYLQVVDENLGGHKDNYFIHEAVRTTVVQNRAGRDIATTVITWTNPALADGGWLVVPYKAFIRVYAPMGSQYLGMQGENGFLTPGVNNRIEHKTWFGGHITIPDVRQSLRQPPVTYHMTVRYALPAGVNLHTWLIQKQPGVPSQAESIRVGRVHYAFTLTRDTLLQLRGIRGGKIRVTRQNWR